MRDRITFFVLALLIIGCRSERATVYLMPSPGNRPGAESNSARSNTPRWPVPVGLPTYGTPSEKTIRVAVLGMNETVRRPGYYYLPRGAVVRDAVEAAKGLGEFAWWRTYSGLERPSPDGTFEVITFTRNRIAEEQIALDDGDILYFGHEVY